MSIFKINVEKIKNVISVDDDFATLINIEKNGDLRFQFHYKVDKHKSIQNNTTKVKISLTQSENSFSEITNEFGRSSNSLQTNEDIDNELSKTLRIKDAAANFDAEQVAQVFGDVTSYISNTDASMMTKQTKLSDIPSLIKTKLQYVTAKTMKSKGLSSISMG